MGWVYAFWVTTQPCFPKLLNKRNKKGNRKSAKQSGTKLDSTNLDLVLEHILAPRNAHLCLMADTKTKDDEVHMIREKSHQNWYLEKGCLRYMMIDLSMFLSLKAKEAMSPSMTTIKEN